MAMIEKIKRLWGKAFVGGEWKVAYRPRNGQDGHYQIVDTPKGTWAADPFLYEVNGEHYLFVELYEEKRTRPALLTISILMVFRVFRERLLSSRIT